MGQPIWSSTTRAAPRSLPTRSIVSTKFGPWVPNSQAVRTIRWLGFASATARSPASFVRP